MPLDPSAGPVYRFGVFQVNSRSGELRKHGIKIKLQEQPLRVLVLLLENAGQVVTREQFQKNLWPDGTYVEYENSINSAVRRLRDALDDSSGSPRFIETVTRRGYRFIAPVTRNGDSPAAPTPPPATETLPGAAAGQNARADGPRHRPFARMALAVAVLIGSCFLLFWNGSAETKGILTLKPGAPLTSYPGIEQHPAFSPDGSRIAYSWNGADHGNYDIYVKLIGAPGEPLPLTDDAAPDTDPAWSPDGRWIAFLRAVSTSKYQIVLVPAMTGPEQRLAEINLGFERSLMGPRLSWSADSKWIYATEGMDDPVNIIRVSVDTREKLPVTAPQGARDVSMAVSPDGLRIAFGRVVQSGALELFVLRLSPDSAAAEKEEQLTFDGKKVSGFAWTPDSSEIVFSSDRGGRRELWRIGVSGRKQPERLTGAGEDATWVAISRSGHRLAYSQAHSSGSDMWSVPAAPGSQPVRVSFHQRGADLSPAWSADGSKIAFDSDRSGNREIWVSQPDGAAPSQITFLGKWSGSPYWSRDDRIAFDSNVSGNWDIYVVNSKGGKPVSVTSDAAADTAPYWSRDGKWIYFASKRTGQSEIWKVPADGGKEEQVTRTGGYHPRESPDGKFLYYSKDKVRGELWRAPAAGGREVRLTDRIFYSSFAPGRKGVYFMERAPYGGLVQLLQPGSGSVESLARLDAPNPCNLTLSPDEKTLLFTMARDAGMEIMVVDDFQQRK
jgi:Tol biopolymer transport system component/DNA-binding winged helix-turn-helix (wHTH) protein